MYGCKPKYPKRQLIMASTNHRRLSFRVWYVRSARLPNAELISLDDINACLPRVALLFLLLLLLLLQHTRNTLVSFSNHSTYCIWLNLHGERYDDYSLEILLAFPVPLFLVIFQQMDINFAALCLKFWFICHHVLYYVVRVENSYHSPLLLRLRLVIDTIRSVPLLLPSDIVHTDLG